MYTLMIPAQLGESRVFDIYREDDNPYPTEDAVGKIELMEATYASEGLYIIPLQVYRTANALLLKLVYALAPLDAVDDWAGCAIQGNNIRTSGMSLDGKIAYGWNENRDALDVVDLAPQRKGTG